ncbi:extracellular solute-binding protein [Halapricum salinum]|uniref:Extracellular solute-binding protein n=1 Tax=Halapricum salinum TaxID=1457250 RepID=A0A4D6H8H8_9EURY|nr:extracellular solute-binding protein [Halapricum salinum]QCC49781.1 extracellular solute-binding protein [Halapricum salinum]
MTDHDSDFDGGASGGRETSSRRRFLAASGVTAVGAVAGCLGGPGGNGDGSSGDGEMNEFSLGSFQGSGPFVGSRPEPSGTSIRDLPNLSGTFGVALGGGEGGLYIDLFEELEEIYPDLTIEHRTAPSTDLANTIKQEADADNVQQDIFLSVDAGSLGVVSEAGATQQLSADAISSVPSAFKDDERNWVGVAGRARAVPYNTNELSASDVPSTVQEFPDTLGGSMGWAPSYGAFQSFITAMRLIHDDETAIQWLEDMQNAGVETYADEFQVSQAVADGNLNAGFANHYYALRVKAWNDDPPIELAFTEGDAGALVNVSGAAVLTGADDTAAATDFVRHLLSAEAQEFFATRTYAYPMIPGVQPVGDLPTVDELDAPDIDLTELSDRGGTLDVMREAGLSV